MKQIAVFGSAFNPPSLGHKSVIDSLEHFDEIILVPSIAHAWGKEMLDYGVRCQLADAFIHDLANPKISRSMIEETLYQPNQSVTTYEVLNALQSDHQDAHLTFIVGPDNLLNFSKFYKAKDILNQFSLLCCPEVMPIRSSQIRDCLLQGQSIAEMTTPTVVNLIISHQLFIG